MTQATTPATEPQEPWIGPRGRIGVIIPSTNISVEYDAQRLGIPGVSWHFGRFMVDQPDLSSDDMFLSFLEAIRSEIPKAVAGLQSAEISHLMMGMSAETFWGGVQGSAEFIARIKDQIGDMGLTTGADAMVDALTAFGTRKIAVLSPYQAVGDGQVQDFFEGSGFEVVRQIGLRCGTATSIAQTPRARVLEVVARELDGKDVEAIVQVGTNLSTVDFFPTLELMTGKPCLPINTATCWKALRAIGVTDKLYGRGRLFEEF